MLVEQKQNEDRWYQCKKPFLQGLPPLPFVTAKIVAKFSLFLLSIDVEFGQVAYFLGNGWFDVRETWWNVC